MPQNNTLLKIQQGLKQSIASMRIERDDDELGPMETWTCSYLYINPAYKDGQGSRQAAVLRLHGTNEQVATLVLEHLCYVHFGCDRKVSVDDWFREYTRSNLTLPDLQSYAVRFTLKSIRFYRDETLEQVYRQG